MHRYGENIKKTHKLSSQAAYDLFRKQYLDINDMLNGKIRVWVKKCTVRILLQVVWNFHAYLQETRLLRNVWILKKGYVIFMDF